MLHLFNWKLQIIDNDQYLINDLFWLKVDYQWEQKSGLFFLHPVLDDNTKTIRYFAFDKHKAKQLFLKISKKKWIWQRTAFSVSSLSLDELWKIVEEFDVKALQALPGIWPKTAKRILIELKTTISESEFKKIDGNDKTVKDITTSLKKMWYDKNKIMAGLEKYDWEISKETMQDIIVWLMKNM